MPACAFRGRLGAFPVETDRFDRYTRPTDPQQMLIFTDGACLDNGGANPQAGWAFVHGPGSDGKPHVAAGRLEEKGPFGEAAVQTSNRAELRAVIAALRFRQWGGEGFSSVVIATDSTYVYDGATQWVRTWPAKGWKTAKGEDVKNRDLWEALMGDMETCHEAGLSIQFWKIQRRFNAVADDAAKRAAANMAVAQWQDVHGVAIPKEPAYLTLGGLFCPMPPKYY